MTFLPSSPLVPGLLALSCCACLYRLFRLRGRPSAIARKCNRALLRGNAAAVGCWKAARRHWLFGSGRPSAIARKREPQDDRSPAEDLEVCAEELLLSHRLPADPKTLADMLAQAADRVCSRFPGLGLAVWTRGPQGSILAHRAGAPDPLGRPLDVPRALWEAADRAIRRGNVASEISREGMRPSPPARECRLQGSLEGGPPPRSVGRRPASELRQRPADPAPRAFAWGCADKTYGVLLAWDAFPPHIAREASRHAPKLLAAYFTSLAEMAAELWELHQARERLEGGLSTLQLVASTITAHPDQPVDSLGAITSIVGRAMEADLCAFLLYDESSGELVMQAGAYGLGNDEGSMYRMPITRSRSSSVRVFLTGVPFSTGDAMNDSRVDTTYAKRWKCHSLMVYPLSLEGKRIGVMRVGSFRKEFFNQDHLRLLGVIAEEVVVLVESAMLTRKLSEANRKLSQINQIKDDFVSTASHEFKTPLTAIKGFLSVLLDGQAGSLTPDQRRFLEIAQGAADRLTSLVTDLLDISRLEGGVRMDFGRVSVAELFEQCRLEHHPQAEDRSLQLRVRPMTSVPPVWGDPRWLRQALDNLVSNAIKFTPAGGMVTISASDQGEMVRLSVEDTGVGIGPEDRARVFDKFYRAKTREGINAPGTGLGLSIAKFIVDRHEGRIWVESEVGAGSGFHVLLPAARQAAGDGRDPTETREETHDTRRS